MPPFWFNKDLRLADDSKLLAWVVTAEAASMAAVAGMELVWARKAAVAGFSGPLAWLETSAAVAGDMAEARLRAEALNEVALIGFCWLAAKLAAIWAWSCSSVGAVEACEDTAVLGTLAEAAKVAC